MKKLAIIATAVLMITLYSCEGGGLVVGTRYETPYYERPPRPAGNYVWIEGDWVSHGGRYEYRHGYWARPRGHRVWVSGSWQSRGNGYYWRRGYWH